MYDRKTWVVLALCGIVLAANVYYSQQAKIEADKKRAAEAALQATLPANPDAVKATDAALTVEPPPPPTEEQTVVLESDKVVFTLSNFGGGIKHADFKDQFQVGSKDIPVRTNRFGAGPIGGLAGSDDTLQNVSYTYKADESTPGKSAVYIVKLPSGLIVKKTYSLVQGDKPGSPYLLDFQVKLENGSANEINLSQWSLFLGEAAPTYQAEVGQQTGVFWRENGGMNFKDSSFKDWFFQSAKSSMRHAATHTVEFAGVTNQFFATAIRPKEAMNSTVWAAKSDVKLTTDAKPVHSVRGGLQLPAVTLKPGEPKSIDYLLFVGPKHNPMLRKMEKDWGDGWGDVMQYGWFSVVSSTLNRLLNWYHVLFDKYATNWAWGLAIILLTVTVRIILWFPAAKATHTMKRMAKLQPEMAKIKEKYPDDPNKVNTETMGLYRKYGINPLGGCLPMLIQIPVFFGFYRMLQYAVELRGAPFLWVHDLSQPDTLAHIPLLGGIPFNILPIVMAITSFLQIRMTPKTGDPTQQKIMMFMPFMFFFFCYNFASALALYWTTQNIFQIGQTWMMNRIPEPELKVRNHDAKKSWVQRMAERQAEMQKLQKQAGGAAGGIRDVTPEKKKPRPPRTGG